MAAGATIAHQDCVEAAVLNHATHAWAASTCAIGGFDHRRWMAEAERNAQIISIVCARYGIAATVAAA